jgi:predicted MPP superfamily phosphohydrolase
VSGAAELSPWRLAPRRFGRGRRAFFRSLQFLAGRCGGRHWYRRRYLAPGRFRVRREVVEVIGLPAELDGYLVVQLSDLHAGPFLGEGDLSAVVEASNRLVPDAVAITGDLITDRPEEADLLLRDFAGLRARDGVFGVFGNHDYRQRREREIAARMAERAGVRFLCDEHVRCRRGSAAVALVGLEDTEESHGCDPDRARAGLHPGDVQIVLCHNPLLASRLAGPRVAAVLSGHSHGHQIDLPGVRRLAPPHPGDRRQLGPTVAITSTGLGALGLPLRVRAPAEIVALELRAAEGRDAR